MGAFYNSICIPGDRHRDVRSSLSRWLAVRGFEPVEQPMLFDLDGETDRNAFLVWNQRWTLIFFSKYEEERRLIRELQGWSERVLYVWVQDSHVWGYDLFRPDGCCGSYSSDPRSYRSFADHDSEPRPLATAEQVCRFFELPGREDELRRIHRIRAVFKEQVCLEFCRLIAADAALTSYDDLEKGSIAERLEGWQVAQLLFVHRDDDERREIDLHSFEWDAVDRSGTDGVPRFEIPPEVLAAMEERRRSARRMLYVLKPLFWAARSWRRLLESSTRSRRPPPERPGSLPVRSRSEKSGVIEVRHLINERHGLEIQLAGGGRPVRGSTKPAAVFSFEIGGTVVTCTARRRSKIEEVLRPPGRAQIARDEKYQVADFRARHVVFELSPHYVAGSSEPAYLGLHVVEIERALYVFLYRYAGRIAAPVEKAIRATVESLRRPA